MTTNHKTDFSLLFRTVLWLLITLFFYLIVRLEFLAWNWKTWFQHSRCEEILSAFMSGARFDSSSIVWLSSVVLLSSLLPWPFVSLNLKAKVLKSVYLLIHLPFLLLNMLDLEFIHFSGRRITINSYYLLKESQGKLSAVFGSYWFIITVNLLLLFLFYRWIAHDNFQKTRSPVFVFFTNTLTKAEQKLESLFRKWVFRIPISVLLLIVYIILARGGLQPKPLEMAHALSISSDQRITNLALNSSFTTIHSLQQKPLRPLYYFSTPEEYVGLLNANTPGKKVNPWDRRPKNVMLIILESFGLEYTGLDHGKQFSFTPFLDSLKTKSIYFENSFANGRRSIEALPSLLAGVPSLMDEPFLTSPFQSHFLPLIGQELQQKNIPSLFFHGGANGTMYFQEFTQRLGFTQYIGKNEYPNSLDDDDGVWGIWDGPFFNFVVQELNRINTPFFSVLFSLSSHHPFQVPDSLKDKLPTGPLPIHQSIAYTDKMLADFFDEASTSDWFKDTLFIITADHTSKSYYEEYQSPTGSFRVPLLMYFPGASFSHDRALIDTSEPVQHIDVFPSLRDLFDLPPAESCQLARSLFQTGPRKVTLYLDGLQILIDKNQSLINSTDTDLNDPTHPLANSWKASRQYFVNSLLDNHF